MFAPIEEIYCVIDDFCKHFEEALEGQALVFDGSSSTKKRKRKRNFRMHLSEIMTIVALFHLSHYRTFKDYYLQCVQGALRGYFASVSYTRFLEIMPSSLMPLSVFLAGIRGKETCVYFGDSTSIKVCHIKRERRNKVFSGLAAKSKSTMGWMFGFKLHLIINNHGELMNCTLTRANVDDRRPVPKLMSKLRGWLFADKGYLGSPLIEKLKAQAVEIFTKVRKNMKARIMKPIQRFYLSKRGIVETVIDQLKNTCQIEHTRHRNVNNAFVNLVSGLVAYCFRPRKPSISLTSLRHSSVLMSS